MCLRGFRLFHTVLSFLQYPSSDPPLHMSQSFSTTVTILGTHILTLKNLNNSSILFLDISMLMCKIFQIQNSYLNSFLIKLWHPFYPRHWYYFLKILWPYWLLHFPPKLYLNPSICFFPVLIKQLTDRLRRTNMSWLHLRKENKAFFLDWLAQEWS